MRVNVSIHPLSQVDVLNGGVNGRIAPATAVPAGRGRLGFALFLIVNVVLFIRPAELFPSMVGWPIYEVAMVGAILASAEILIRQFTWHALSARPITLCALGMLAAIILSHLSHFNAYEARIGAEAFCKILLYFFLLVGLVDSERRLRIFLLAVVVLTAVTAALSILNHHGIVDIEAFTALNQWTGFNEETGDRETMLRVQGLGIFGDPNDFALILVVAILVALHVMIEDRRWLVRTVLALPLLISAYCVALTSSRGGFLALLAGLMVLMASRWRWWRAVPLAVLVLPLVLLAFAGRQTDINLDADDTAIGRITLWRDGLVLFHGSPLFGIGRGMMAEENGHVAHNAFVHSYTELGMFGGTLFVGMIFASVSGVRRVRLSESDADKIDIVTWRPCLLSILAAYTIGISFLSRAYALPTYLVVGVATAYCAIGTRAGESSSPLVFNRRFCAQVLGVSIGYLILIEVFVRIML
jgi:hypothetical protein